MIQVGFNLVVTWITTEAVICTAATLGTYYLGSAISEAVNNDSTDTGTGTQTETKPKGKRKGTQQTSGFFTNLRPLPITEDGIPIPDIDVPPTQLGTSEGGLGKYPQAREFDYNGVPVRTIDFTDHGRPHDHTNPHQHVRKPNPTGGTPKRGDAEPVPEWRYML